MNTITCMIRWNPLFSGTMLVFSERCHHYPDCTNTPCSGNDTHAECHHGTCTCISHLSKLIYFKFIFILNQYHIFVYNNFVECKIKGYICSQLILFSLMMIFHWLPMSYFYSYILFLREIVREILWSRHIIITK